MGARLQELGKLVPLQHFPTSSSQAPKVGGVGLTVPRIELSLSALVPIVAVLVFSVDFCWCPTPTLEEHNAHFR